ncbi:MAG TPA: AI-2E family transporter [Candidatus Binatia bacterium]|nr:AI-2E family transporter [Candidatus Binatia bacterium]
MTERESPRALIAWTAGVLLAAAALGWALYTIRQVLVVIYVSVLLAIGFSPLVRLIERQGVLQIGTRVPRWLAILTLYLAILVVVAAIAIVVFPPLVTQAREVATHLPDFVERAQRFLVARGIIHERKTFGEIVQQQAPGGSDVVGTMIFTFWGLLGGVLGVVSILILTFYLLVDSDSMLQALVRLFRTDRRARVEAISRQITTKVSAWLMGQLTLAAIVGATSALWLGLLGMPYFYVLALLAAVGEMIPIVGPVLSAIPGIAVALGQSWQLALVVALLYLLQQQLEANLLVPKLMERQVGLHPVTIITSLLIGGALLGVPGAMLAVPTAAILQVLVQELLSERA